MEVILIVNEKDDRDSSGLEKINFKAPKEEKAAITNFQKSRGILTFSEATRQLIRKGLQAVEAEERGKNS